MKPRVSPCFASLVTPTALLAALIICFPEARLAAAQTNANRTALRSWLEYRSIMWVSDSAYRTPDKIPLFFQRLREMGINTAMVHGDGRAQPLLDASFPYYVENMINRGLCLKWNSKVRDWNQFITGWNKAGRPDTAFVREHCLDDPQWLTWATNEMQRLARQHRGRAPVAYDIRDELSVTISANPFDFDFHPLALKQFRLWLQTQYPSLEALNQQWETKFASWAEVKPFSTDQIKSRLASGTAALPAQPDWSALQRLKFDPVSARREPTRWNFSPWCDFRSYMDLSLARTLDTLRGAARTVDPETPVGIEGTQMPHAFGGYDLWRLANALDWVEPYDIGNAREIFGSFMPGQPMLCTVFEKETRPALRRLWHLLLEGDRGCIIWWSEDCLNWKSEDYALTAKARALAPVLKEMTSSVARLFLRAQREFDPIAIHYSQPSIQVDWLLESTADGSSWPRRFSSFEADHNRMARVRAAWVKAFQDLGFTPRFISSEEVARGELRQRGCRVFVMPQSLALSAKEAEEIRAFMFEKGDPPLPERWLICDGSPGLFDEHGKLQPRSPLEDWFPAATSSARSYAHPSRGPTGSRDGDVSVYAGDRLAAAPRLEWAEWVRASLGDFTAEVQVPLETRTRVHRYQLGPARLFAFERGINYHMSEELKQAGGNEPLEQPVEFEARWPRSGHVYDLRGSRYLGQTDRVRVVLDPWQPSRFALLPARVAERDLIKTLEGFATR